MKPLIFLILIIGCSVPEKRIDDSQAGRPNRNEWKKQTASIDPNDSLRMGSTYLSVYSQVYQHTEHRTYNLTATVSMRNISSSDTIYISKADYFDTHGNLVTEYLDNTVFILPHETIEIVVAQTDETGGTGGNFIFDWATNAGSPDPYFECVMISTSGQQGLSLVTTGVKR